MTTTVQVYAFDFFRLIKAEPNTKFCDMFIRRFDRTAFYRRTKLNVHFATP